METPAVQSKGLWTKDFTIITIGSLVSMLGNTMSGFAMSLLVLDYTGSTLAYAIYIACFMLPQLVMPIFSGAILDRFSRLKTIYTLDFVSAGLYLLFAILLGKGWFSFPILAITCVFLGTIDSVYVVAYESFYPLLITEGNYQKAYSIASIFETMSFFMVPVSTFFYNKIGIAPLLAVDAVTFFIAAVMETKITHKEEYIEKQKEALLESGEELKGAKLVLKDIKEGFDYLKSEKGLLFVALYFFFSSLAGGAEETMGLPFFKDAFENGEYLFSIVYGGGVIARAVGGTLHYKFKIPAKYRYTIAFAVYICLNIMAGIYLYMPIPVMFAMCVVEGMMGVTSYTIRISATQSYVPDEKKGRFNGAIEMLFTAGFFFGTTISGALSEVVPDIRYVVTGFMLVSLIAAIVFIGGNKKYIAPLYNTEN
ncbi:MAG: MFS transporter [Clostridia bacterium]|nr:MFS transporter [Clostridia bacterium]